MEMDEVKDKIPCSTLAVDSIVRLGTAGLAWGFFSGRYEADKQGLTGSGKASFVVKSVGKYGLHWGVFAGVFSATRCGVQRYRMEKDWVNSCIAGAVTGAALAARTRSWVQVLGTAAMVSAITSAADYTLAL
ncbi:mitochondrial import inner membrane translocase subunit Tim17/Tim22/Tim23 family protein isoform X2 [Tasmannia lanceolata]|uniref:mitochondrial import inner membrane translocase subunit Tim17/Tim22/Tim23 family protein isoform X2 n=1 Tax=Tasmannia lanceolata TaxID=3420 RepID=UPI00406348CF